MIYSKSRKSYGIATEEKTCVVPYLKPHPVPPRTIAATRMAPAMDPIIRLVALGPVVKDYGKKNIRTNHKRES